ncbi:hypothetical protein RvY_06455 [Ramazzottius varieornatus]|uniref:Uncharacterized protein n=1 Tax=Ramazzottius varieornatus TaxID=947166 RepID=A0A1D1V438_RAMVA|nr:hypothetical protein RvY_06455 [Ramazzottius varieornatus]
MLGDYGKYINSDPAIPVQFPAVEAVVGTLDTMLDTTSRVERWKFLYQKSSRVEKKTPKTPLLQACSNRLGATQTMVESHPPYSQMSRRQSKSRNSSLWAAVDAEKI